MLNRAANGVTHYQKNSKDYCWRQLDMLIKCAVLSVGSLWLASSQYLTSTRW